MGSLTDKNTPLVSVCVISYNSASTIEDTLDSVYSQTYTNIELLISDDCSSDNTIEIARKWIAKYQDRFVRVEVITVDNNTGTNKNLNRVFKASNGEWLKLLSGDDLLVPHALKKYVTYCTENNLSACISRVEYFGDLDRITQKKITYESFYRLYKNCTREERCKLLLHQCALPTPSLIVSKKLLEKINYLDEYYKLYEEWPFLLKILDSGADIPYIEDRLVKYRCESNSLSSTTFTSSKKGETYQGARYQLYLDALHFYKNYRRPRLMKQLRLYAIWDQDLYFNIYSLMNIPNRTVWQKVLLLFWRIIAPGTYVQLYSYLKNASQTQIKNKIRGYLKF